MTADQKVQHCRKAVCNALMQVSIEEGRGQPPMVERLLAAANMVDELVSNGVPFEVGRNSRMNKELRIKLHEEALRSADNRKSRSKRIAARHLPGLVTSNRMAPPKQRPLHENVPVYGINPPTRAA